MNRQEFVEKLRISLNGTLTPEQVAENIRYYDDYINTQMQSGRNEEEVLDGLGDPRLIAKSIISASKEADSRTAGSWEDANQRNHRPEDPNRAGHSDLEKTSGGLPGWAIGLILVLVTFLVIGLVFSIISALAPLILVILVVVFFVKLFRDWLN